MEPGLRGKESAILTSLHLQQLIKQAHCLYHSVCPPVGDSAAERLAQRQSGAETIIGGLVAAQFDSCSVLEKIDVCVTGVHGMMECRWFTPAAWPATRTHRMAGTPADSSEDEHSEAVCLSVARKRQADSMKGSMAITRPVSPIVSQ